MIGFEKVKLYTDRLVELDTTDKFVNISDGTLPCGLMRESGETHIERQSLQNYYGLITPVGCGIIAEGDSMVDAQINDGDELMVDPCRMVQNGVVVVAYYHNEVTVKTYFRDPKTGTVVLFPENEDKGYPPIVIEDPEELEIRGVVVRASHCPERKSNTEMQQRMTQLCKQRDLLEIIERTADAGYMTNDGRWLDHVKQDFMAVWIDEVCDRLNIDDKWSWAQERWEVPTLRQSLYRLKGTDRYGEIFDEVKALLE